MPNSDLIEAAAKAGYLWVKSQRPVEYGPYESWEELDINYRAYLIGIQQAAFESARVLPKTYKTLGDIAVELRRMKADGVTLESLKYAVDRVWAE